MGSTIVVALGGNAILRAGEKGTASNQIRAVNETAAAMTRLVRAGHTLVMTHGNGPQVGNILLQGEMARDHVPPMPLDICVAQSQGLIGYMLQQGLDNQLRRGGLDLLVATVVTRVVVEQDDPAFCAPSKPIGPYFTRKQAEHFEAQHGFIMKECNNRGWRRVVASPVPQEICEIEAVEALMAAGSIVIVSGGGGIPVVRSDDGSLYGVEAVVDKDLTGEILARQVCADLFVILTDVGGVALNWGTQDQVMLDKLTCSDAWEYLAEGHFAPGSMAPKVTAAAKFVSGGRGQAVITSLNKIEDALAGLGGTWVVPDIYQGTSVNFFE